ncbi:PilZ domain-containing protein [Desulfothermus naphthae]
MKDRREFQRLNKELGVEVRKFEYPLKSQRIIKTKCLNISPGGLLLDIPRRLNVGDKVQLTLYVPGLNKYHPSFFKVFESSVNQSLVAVGEVVRVEVTGGSYKVGIKFLNIYEDDWKALYNLLMRELKR